MQALTHTHVHRNHPALQNTTKKKRKTATSNSKSCLRFLKSPKVRNYGSSFNHALVNFTFCGVGALADCPKLPTDKLKNSFSKWYIFYGEKDTFNPNYLVTSISLYFPNCSFNSSETILLLYQCSNPLLGLV